MQTDRANAEDRLHVHEPDAANLHVMSLELVAAPYDDVMPAAGGNDQVVGNQAVTTLHEIEHALGLADAALSYEQKSDAVDVCERAMKRCGWRKLFRDRRFHAREELRGFERAPQDRHAAMPRRLHHFVRDVLPLRHDDAGNLEGEEQLHDLAAPRGRERREVGDLRFAEHQHAVRRETIDVSREHEPRTRHLAAENLARESRIVAQQLELQRLPHELEHALDREGFPHVSTLRITPPSPR